MPSPPPLLPSLAALERLVSGHQPSRIGNVDVYAASDAAGGAVGVCHLPQIFPFSRYKDFYQGAVAVALAAQHLNAGDGRVISEVSGLDRRCRVRFTTQAHDLREEEVEAMDIILNITDRDRRRLPCALLGAARSSISVPTSIISGLRGYPQISPSSTSDALNDPVLHPLFGRTIPSDDSTSIPLVSYMHDELEIRHLAVLHTADSYGNSFARGIQVAAENLTPGLSIETTTITHESSDGSLDRAIDDLKKTQYRYFFCITTMDIHDDILSKAFEAGIAGTGEYNWFFSDSLRWPTNRKFRIGSPLEKAYRGTAVIAASGGISQEGGHSEPFDSLGRAMESIRLSSEDIEFLRTIFPPDSDYTSILDDESFLSSVTTFTPFLYDAVIGLGLAACEAASQGNGPYFDGWQLFSAFARQTFEGTSGFVRFDNATGSRDPNTAFFSVINFRDWEEQSNKTHVEFKANTTGVFKAGKYHEYIPFVFNDNSTVAPPDLPAPSTNYNHLPRGLEADGLILCFIIIALSCAFSVWTYTNRKNLVVRKSQPIFLQIILLGTVIMASSIIPLGLDKGAGKDAACMAVPWTLFLGFSFTFAALFTKTHRINKLMKSAKKMKRMRLTPMDVAQPMIAMLVLNIIILALWTRISPVRRTNKDLTYDSFGRVKTGYTICHSEHEIAFLTSLAIINGGTLVVAILQAYMARHIESELSESEYIFRALALIALSVAIGAPVMIIARKNTLALYVLKIGIISTICFSVLLLIFIPKIIAKRKYEREGHTPATMISGLHSRLLPTTESEQEEGILVTSRMELKATIRQLEDENKGLRNEIQQLRQRVPQI